MTSKMASIEQEKEKEEVVWSVVWLCDGNGCHPFASGQRCTPYATKVSLPTP